MCRVNVKGREQQENRRVLFISREGSCSSIILLAAAGFLTQTRSWCFANLELVVAGDNLLTLEELLSYLSLGQSKVGRKLGSLRQSKILGPLKPSLQLLDLERGIDGPWFSHFLALTINST